MGQDLIVLVFGRPGLQCCGNSRCSLLTVWGNGKSQVMALSDLVFTEAVFLLSSHVAEGLLLRKHTNLVHESSIFVAHPLSRGPIPDTTHGIQRSNLEGFLTHVQMLHKPKLSKLILKRNGSWLGESSRELSVGQTDVSFSVTGTHGLRGGCLTSLSPSAPTSKVVVCVNGVH